jgi:hypothetical protein
MPTTPIFSKEDAEAARRLGFKFPEKRGQASVPDPTTFVVGYFNPNPFPIHISISSIGYAVDLLNRMDYIVINGKKVNDPLLEQYVGHGRLSREVSKTKVPVVPLPRSEARIASEQSPVTSADGFNRDKDGKIQPTFRPIAAKIIPDSEKIPQLPPPGSATPVIGMSREMAEKLRLVKPTRQIQESNVIDTDGIPASGSHLPEIQYATDIPRPASAPTPPAPAPAAVPAAPDEPEVAQEILQKLNTAAENTGLLETIDAAKLMPRLEESQPATEGAPPAPAPPPNPPVQAAPTAEVKKKFTCSGCGESFPYRSVLERHVRHKHPREYDGIMMAYPA